MFTLDSKGHLSTKPYKSRCGGTSAVRSHATFSYRGKDYTIATKAIQTAYGEVNTNNLEWELRNTEYPLVLKYYATNDANKTPISK